MLIVHHLENSRSQRLLWLLEEMGLDYQVRRYERDKITMRAPPELMLIHPLGKSPLLGDDGVIFAESGAIVEHLVARTGQFGPSPDPDTIRRYSMFLHYAEGSMMPPLIALLILGRLGDGGQPGIAPVLGMFAEHFAFLESELSGRPWFAGNDFTAADVMMSFPIEAARGRAGLDERYPNILDWLARIHARPAYQRALDVGGPYAYA